MTHDYKRNAPQRCSPRSIRNRRGLCLCQSGIVIRSAEVLAHDRPDRCRGKQVHIICDNYATHKHPRSSAGLQHNASMCTSPHFCLVLNMIERFFRDLTDKRIRRSASRISNNSSWHR